MREVAAHVMVAPTTFLPGPLPEVALRSSDSAWAHGRGPEVVGPSAALGTVLAGRPAQLGRLSGDGVTVLERWLPRRPG